MSILTIRLPEELFNTVKETSALLHLSTTAYARNALIRMNQEVIVEQKRKKMQAASLKVRDESIKVNQEFSEIEGDIED